MIQQLRITVSELEAKQGNFQTELNSNIRCLKQSSSFAYGEAQTRIKDLEQLILERTEALEEKQDAYDELTAVFKQIEEENRNLCNDLNEAHKIIREQDDLILEKGKQIVSLSKELDAKLEFQAKLNE